MKHHKLTASLLIACSLASTAVGSEPKFDQDSIDRNTRIMTGNNGLHDLTASVVGIIAIAVTPAIILKSKPGMRHIFDIERILQPGIPRSISTLGCAGVIGTSFLYCISLDRTYREIMFLDNHASKTREWHEMTETDRDELREKLSPRSVNSDYDFFTAIGQRLKTQNSIQLMASTAAVLLPVILSLRKPEFIMRTMPDSQLYLGATMLVGSAYLYIGLDARGALERQLELAGELILLNKRDLENKAKTVE